MTLADYEDGPRTQNACTVKWVELMREELPKVFSTNPLGIVEPRRRLKDFDGPEATVLTENARGAQGNYSVVFTNKGEKLKPNPNRINFKVSGSKRVFSRCLVSDCHNAPYRGGNLQGLCKGRQHKHLEVIDRAKDITPQGVYHVRRTDESGHLVTEKAISDQEAKVVIKALRAERDLSTGRESRLWGPAELARLDHYADWVGVIREKGTGREFFAPWHGGIAEALLGWIDADADSDRGRRADAFVSDVLQMVVVGHVKDSTTMQIELEKGVSQTETPCKGLGAYGVVSSVRDAVNRYFEHDDEGMNWTWAGMRFNGVPVRAVAAMMALGFAAEEANRSDAWFCKEILGSVKPHYASAYMSATYYLLRRAGATVEQATMVVVAMTR